MPKRDSIPTVFTQPIWTWDFRVPNGTQRYGSVTSSLKLENVSGEDMLRGLVVPSELNHYLLSRHGNGGDTTLILRIESTRAYLAYELHDGSRYYLFYWTKGNIPTMLKRYLT